MVIKELVVSDLTFVEYNERQQKEILPEQVEYRANTVRPANQFVYSNGQWTPNEYEGFAVVSMVNNNPGNFSLSRKLQNIQRQLMERLDATAYFFLPAESFHQTIANTVSDKRFKENIETSGKENVYPGLIEKAFQNIPGTDSNMPIAMKLAGVSIFGTAIGISGIIASEEDYKKITSFRSHFYRCEALKDLDVKMTRPFIGHITLAYIERELTSKEKNDLAVAVNEINASLIGNAPEFLIFLTELRRYHHLAEFKREEHYPVFHFNN